MLPPVFDVNASPNYITHGLGGWIAALFLIVVFFVLPMLFRRTLRRRRRN